MSAGIGSTYSAAYRNAGSYSITLTDFSAAVLVIPVTVMNRRSQIALGGQARLAGDGVIGGAASRAK